MSKIFSLVYLLLFALFVSFSASCDSSWKREKERKELMQEITVYQQNLPYTIDELGITVTNIKYDNNIIVFSSNISDENW